MLCKGLASFGAKRRLRGELVPGERSARDYCFARHKPTASLREASPEHECLRLKCAWLGFQIAGPTPRFVAKPGSCAYSFAVKASLPEIIPESIASPLQRGGSESRPAHERTDAKMPPLKSMYATTDLRRGRADSKRLLVYVQKAANSRTPGRASGSGELP